MAEILGLDPRQKPPEFIKEVYKSFQKLSYDAIDDNSEILDFKSGLTAEQHERCQEIEKRHCGIFQSTCSCLDYLPGKCRSCSTNVSVFEHQDVPGKFLERDQCLSNGD